MLNFAACNPFGAFGCVSHTCEDKPVQGPRPRLRVGSTPGLRDEPVNSWLARKIYERMPTAVVEWVLCPCDLDAVTAMLNAGLVDVAMMYSEEAMLQMALTGSLRVCGMFSAVPRKWTLLVPKGSSKQKACDLARCRLGVPAGLASRMMAIAVEEEFGWTGMNAPVQVHQDSLSEGLNSMITFNSVQALLWEKSTLDSGSIMDNCDVIHEVDMPWVSHLFVASKDTAVSKLGTIRMLLDFSNALIHEFKVADKTTSDEYLAERYGMNVHEVNEWMQEANWRFNLHVDGAAISGPLELLTRLELQPPPRNINIKRCLANGVRILPTAQDSRRADSPGADCADEFDEGSAGPISQSRSHHFLTDDPEPCDGSVLIQAHPALSSTPVRRLGPMGMTPLAGDDALAICDGNRVKSPVPAG